MNLRQQVFRHVRLRAAILAGFVERSRLAHHQLGRAHADIGPRNGELDALILSDRTAEHHALAGIGRSFLDEPFGVTDAFGGNENALGVHA